LKYRIDQTGTPVAAPQADILTEVTQIPTGASSAKP